MWFEWEVGSDVTAGFRRTKYSGMSISRFSGRTGFFKFLGILDVEILGGNISSENMQFLLKTHSVTLQSSVALDDVCS
jgi:hypothetical protein